MQVDHHTNIIELSHVSFQYDQVPVLEDVSLDVHLGDYLGVIGPNGGGKTTLLKIILGLLHPDTGTVRLFGTPIEKFHDWSKIGYVPQRATHFDSQFPATVREVVNMPIHSKGSRAVDEALAHVGLSALGNRRIATLSGGQQQRVFIARALVTNPKVIILDEPTVGVDTPTQTQFYELLKKLNRELDLTLILVSHDISMIVKETTELARVNRTMSYDPHPHT